MIPLKKHALVLALLCCTAMLQAQVTFKSLQEVWDFADAHNAAIKTAEINKTIAATGVKQAYGALLPSVTANGGFTDNLQIQSTLIPANLFDPAAPAGTYTEATFGRRYNYSGNVIAEMDILNTQDWFAVKAAKLNKEIAAISIAQSKKDLYGQLANSYYSCMLLSEAERLSLENLRAITDVYAISLQKFNDGLISEVTLNLAGINKQKAEKSLDVARQNKLLQLNTLKSLLGSDQDIEITEELNEDFFFSADTGFAPDPTVQLYSLQAMVSKNEMQSQRAAFAPTLSAVYQYSTLVAGDDFVRFANSNTIPQQYWGLRLSVPIFAGNSRRYEVQKDKLDYAAKQKQYNNAVLQNTINNTNLLIAYRGALQAYTASKSILERYRANDAHAAQRMQEGLISLDERLEFYSDMIISQNEYLQSMSDYLIQEYRLKISQTNLIR